MNYHSSSSYPRKTFIKYWMAQALSPHIQPSQRLSSDGFISGSPAEDLQKSNKTSDMSITEKQGFYITGSRIYNGLRNGFESFLSYALAM